MALKFIDWDNYQSKHPCNKRNHHHSWYPISMCHDDNDIVPKAVWFVCECGLRKCVMMNDLPEFKEAKKRLEKIKR